MKKQVLVAGAAVVALLLVVAAGALYYYVLGPTKAASGPITAIPVGQATDAPALAADDGMLVLNIDQDQSQVTFTLSEVLSGQPTTVVGTSNQVAGQIAINPDDLSSVQVGVIQVNARTLTTDRSQRNSAIRNRILNTDTYEFITFTPTEVRGLTGSAAPGDSFSFQLVGDLTIRDVTQPVVFEVTATADSATQLSGSATTTVQRGDFNLIIPSVPQVADVSEAVQLQINFVATPVS